MILFEHDCSKLLEELQSNLTWKWDDRFRMALVEISADDKDAIGKMLENHLGTPWNSNSADTAPETVQTILVRLGGMMPNQLLYVAGLPGDDLIFCAWWPWGNGMTISVRIGTNQESSSLLARLVPLDAR